MAKEKKLVEAITSMEEDFTQWYTDVVKKAELMDYSSVKGCMIFKPNGYAIWENIQKNLDAMFKETSYSKAVLNIFCCMLSVVPVILPSLSYVKAWLCRPAMDIDLIRLLTLVSYV